MRGAGHHLLCVAFAFLCSASAEAQRVERTTLSNPEESFQEPFSALAGLRELSDGRLIVTDRIEQVVRMVDLETGGFADVGRVGDGPGEYQVPGILFRLPGDSTLLTDLGNMRMSVIGPDGRITRSFPLMRSDGLLVRPAHVDGQGRIYFEYSNMVFTGTATDGFVHADATPIARWDTSTELIDTVGYVSMRGRERTRMRRGDPNQHLRFFPPPFVGRDVWSISVDGDVVTVFADPYHVEWQHEDGRKVVGPTVQYESVPVNSTEKEAWIDLHSSGSVTMISGEPGGGRSSRRLPRPDASDFEWPDNKPPFRVDGVHVTPEGELWVGRHVGTGEPFVYDVFDESGLRVKEIQLPEGRRLVGFGPGTLYTVIADAADLQWLERYAR